RLSRRCVSGNPEGGNGRCIDPSARSGLAARMHRLLREPLLQFLLLGAVLVVLRGALGPPSDSRRIEVDETARRGLLQDQLRRTGAAPTPEEERRLIER